LCYIDSLYFITKVRVKNSHGQKEEDPKEEKKRSYRTMQKKTDGSSVGVVAVPCA